MKRKTVRNINKKVFNAYMNSLLIGAIHGSKWNGEEEGMQEVIPDSENYSIEFVYKTDTPSEQFVKVFEEKFSEA